MQNQSLFLIYDGKYVAFMPQNSIGVMDRHQMTDGPSNPTFSVMLNIPKQIRMIHHSVLQLTCNHPLCFQPYTEEI
jgi:hypothetical protein